MKKYVKEHRNHYLNTKEKYEEYTKCDKKREYLLSSLQPQAINLLYSN